MEHTESLLQISATLIALVGLYLIWNQLKLLHRQTAFLSLTNFQETVNKPELQEALRFVYGCKPDKLANPSTLKELVNIELILNNYDLLAWRIKKGIIPLDEVLEIEWPVLLRFWQQLNKFVDNEKKRRGNVPYKESLKWLIEKANEYKESHYPKAPIIIVKKEYDKK